MREFFGFDKPSWPIEGYMSWQHLTFITVVMVLMIALAIFFGLRNKNKDEKAKNRVLIVSSIAIDGFETLKIIIFCARAKSLHPILQTLPLYLCSMQLIMIPIAAFARGRLKEIALDFVFIFGVIGCWMGTYFSSENYTNFPVLAFDNVVSAITHAISGFAALYIVISGMASMKWKNLPWTCLVMSIFCLFAYVASRLVPWNYMFILRHDDTPYKILFDLVKGNPVAYPIGVALLFLIYCIAFYGAYHLVQLLFGKRKRAKAA